MGKVDILTLALCDACAVEHGTIQRCFDARALSAARCSSSLEAEALPGGHYLAEEIHDLVLNRFLAFFGA